MRNRRQLEGFCCLGPVARSSPRFAVHGCSVFRDRRRRTRERFKPRRGIRATCLLPLKKIEGAKISTFNNEGRNAVGAPFLHPPHFRRLCRFIRSGTDSAPRHSGITRDVRSRRKASRSWKFRLTTSGISAESTYVSAHCGGQTVSDPDKTASAARVWTSTETQMSESSPRASGISARSATQYSRNHQGENCIKNGCLLSEGVDFVRFAS